MKSLRVPIGMIFASSLCSAGTLTAEQMNFFSSLQVVAWDLAQFASFQGGTVGIQSSTSSFSNVGWSTSINGTHQGQPFVLTYTGTFDEVLGQGTWNGAGYFGTTPLLSSGSVIFGPGDEAVFDQVFVDGEVGGKIILTLREGKPAEWSVTFYGLSNTNGWTYGGDATWNLTTGKIEAALRASGLTSNQEKLSLELILKGLQNGSAVEFNYKMTEFPEPSSVVLTAGGLLVLILHRSRMLRMPN